MNNVEHFFRFYLDAIAPVLPIASILANYRKLKNSPTLFIFLFFLAALVLFATCDVLGDFGFNNLWLYNKIPLFFATILFPFYFRIISQVDRKYFIAVFAGFVASILYRVDLLFSRESFASVFFISFSLLTLINSIIYLRRGFLEVDAVVIWKKLPFWFNIILVFYTSICSVLWMSFKLLIDKGQRLGATEHELKRIGDLWGWHNNVFFISCFIFAIVINWKKLETT